MTRLRGFKQVNVFTSSPLNGNPLAVVLDADDLSDEQMKAIARWTNLSEITFVLSPTTPPLTIGYEFLLLNLNYLSRGIQHWTPLMPCWKTEFLCSAPVKSFSSVHMVW